jgi:medium-chain acyl-[acyl-carrier-protein] hydrolase
MNGPWLIAPRPQAHKRFRLFCFPFAGGSASVYRRWPVLAAPHIDVCGVEYPGRGARLMEEPFVSISPLVRHLADLMQPVLDRPFAFFGHSMGGLVAFELVRTLRERGARPPDHLFVSGTAAPGRPPTRRSLYGATDAEVLDELRELGGTPPELLADKEMMAMAVRALRADYTVLGTYEYRATAPLDVPLTVFGGHADTVAPPAELRDWRAHGVAGCHFRFFPGGHFFLHDAAGDILRTVAERIAPAAQVATETVPS